MYIDGVMTYDEAMTASDSPTNLAWLINQNAPSARVNSMENEQTAKEPRRTAADFTSMLIDPEMLDQPH